MRHTIYILALAASWLAATDALATTQSPHRAIQRAYERARQEVTNDISMSPGEYDQKIRQLFRDNQWKDAEIYLKAAEREWGSMSTLSYLYGRYWQHEGDNDKARRYLIRAINDDEANTEALEALIKLEEEEKNYSTAIVHINDLLKYSPYNKRLWRKMIALYRAQNNDTEADRLLERLASIYPEDEQIRKDLIYRKELEIQRLRQEGNEQEVQTSIEQLIISNPTEAQYYLDLSSSQLREGRNDDALATCARGVNNTHGNRSLIRRRVSILSDLARHEEAEIYLDECIRRYGPAGLNELKTNLKTEAAQAADSHDVYTRYRRIYGATQSDESLDWLIRTAMQRGYWDDAQYYISEARRKHGDTPELLAKAYTTERRLGNDRAASRLLEDRYLADTTDTDVRDMLAEKRLRAGTDLMSDELWADALTPLRQAETLTSDSDMLAVITRRIAACERMLPDTTRLDTLPDEDDMQRSIRFEREHNLDSAYASLMRYRPGLDEYHYVTRHRHNLLARLLKNNLTLDYQFARRSSIDEWNHNAYATYSHNFGHDVVEALASYVGRESASWTEEIDEGEEEVVSTGGGTGVQLGAGYAHYFEWGDISTQAAWANRFLPRFSLKLSVSENLPAEWTLTERLSWRYINDEDSRYHLMSTGIGASWQKNCFYLAPTLDLFLMRQNVYVNGGLKMQYFPLDGDRSHLFTGVGVGNAPELSLLDTNLPIRFAHLNTNVSAGGHYVVNGHVGLSASFTWYVMGNNDNTVRNYLYLNISTNISF